MTKNMEKQFKKYSAKELKELMAAQSKRILKAATNDDLLLAANLTSDLRLMIKLYDLKTKNRHRANKKPIVAKTPEERLAELEQKGKIFKGSLLLKSECQGR